MNESKSDIKNWTPLQLAKWLSTLGAGTTWSSTVSKFLQEEIDGDEFLELDRESLVEDMNIPEDQATYILEMRELKEGNHFNFKDTKMQDWTSNQVEDFVKDAFKGKSFGNKLADKFSNIDGKKFINMSKHDIKNLGISSFKATKLLQARDILRISRPPSGFHFKSKRRRRSKRRRSKKRRSKKRRSKKRRSKKRSL